MKLRIYDPIVLAIDLRHRRLGYAAFRGRHVLLDWGNRVYRAVGDLEKLLAGKRLSKLIDEIKPHAIILKKERWERGHTDHHMGNVVEAVQGVATIRAIPIHLIDQNEIRTSFARLDCSTREEIAATLARMFSELLWDLPPKRKAWQAEHPRMSMFDAVALGLTYWLTAGASLIVDGPLSGQE